MIILKLKIITLFKWKKINYKIYLQIYIRFNIKKNKTNFKKKLKKLLKNRMKENVIIIIIFNFKKLFIVKISLLNFFFNLINK